ncbi:MAG: SpoIID/LytB domain-containing protein [Clostridia bacterium]|nr:SpoIID/LytB domain-containing protein [Clostridia bacterium]
MKKTLRLLAAALAVGTALLLPISAAPTGEDPSVKIGLAYGNNARPSPKLLNLSGQEEGYDFGWFDDDNAFVDVGYTEIRDIVMLKDKFIYMSSDEDFTDLKPSDCVKTIQPYHIETDDSFRTFEKAQAAAEEIRDLGMIAFPAYHDDEYKVRVGEYGTLSAAKLAIADAEAELDYTFTAAGGSTTCYTVAECSSGDILFEFDQGGQPFGIMPWSEETWFAGYRYTGGFEYNRVNGNDLTVINVLGIHDYVKGVITREMSPSWNVEALKAQALCAKSYTMCNLGKHKSLGFDICNTTCCQVYSGTSQQNANSNEAVDDTFGLFMLYDGEIVDAFYHASSGGYTEDAKNVWGTEVPYLKAVKDKHLTQTLPYEFTVTNSELKNILKAKGYSITGNIVDFYVSETTDAGNVRAITFVQDNGKQLVFTGEKARTILNNSSYGYQVKSMRFTVTPTSGSNASAATTKTPVNDSWLTTLLTKLYAIGSGGTSRIKVGTDDAYALTAAGKVPLSDLTTTTGSSSSGGTSNAYIVSGTGSGHNIGLSQWGAKAMADKGYDFEEILHFYFTDIDIDYLD